ncbi:circumsporozoite protein-like [Abrus precatorius]|uniref:Circumsporozoite protein-like n=1 Tax=Abrus precatorius TaxID=3816 RepID=A0A8B8K6W4_ABRPR|nr:circumsporozoite protein-like [Abrus precatorius]
MANPLETAPFSDGPGASAGGEEMEDGGTAGDGEDGDVGVGDGGELTTEAGDGAAAGGVFDEGGDEALGVADLGAAAAGLGDDAGDCAAAEKTSMATKIKTSVEE